MFSKPLTKLQEGILAFINDFIRQRGYPPTVREIGQSCSISAPSSVAYHLGILRKKGLLKRRDAISRGLSLTEDPNRLPVLGRVGAGGGQIAQEDVEDHIRVDNDFMKRSDFILHVHGDSMIDAGIFDGDYVQVRKQDTALEGEIVVAIIEEEGVVKRLIKDKRQWVLKSENKNYPPIREEFKVVGKVVGLIRRYQS